VPPLYPCAADSQDVQGNHWRQPPSAVSREAAVAGDPRARGPSSLAGPGPAQCPRSNQHWAQIIQRLTELLSTLKANFVPPFLIRRLFTQVFSFINVQLFNRCAPPCLATQPACLPALAAAHKPAEGAGSLWQGRVPRLPVSRQPWRL